MYNLALNNPRILRDGSVCLSSICALLSYSSQNGTLLFNVTGFSAYSAEDYCGNGHCDSDESCTSCSTDCGGCPGVVSTSSGGGGSGGSSVISNEQARYTGVIEGGRTKELIYTLEV